MSRFSSPGTAKILSTPSLSHGFAAAMGSTVAGKKPIGLIEECPTLLRGRRNEPIDPDPFKIRRVFSSLVAVPFCASKTF